MILPNGTLVAVADGTSLQLLRNKGTETTLRLVPEDGEAIVPGNPGSGARHRNSSANPDPDRREEDSFVAAAAAELNRLTSSGGAVHFYLIADPRTLGELRKHLAPAASTALLGELGRDLVGRPIREIEAAILEAR